jgi:hypothetical protein
VGFEKIEVCFAALAAEVIIKILYGLKNKFGGLGMKCIFVETFKL